jgi:hypothetical protein
VAAAVVGRSARSRQEQTAGAGSEIADSKFQIPDPRPRRKQTPKTEFQEAKDQRPKTKDQEPKTKAQSTKHKAQSTKHKAQSTKNNCH